MTRRRWLSCFLALAAVLAVAGPARAELRRYVIAIGNNARPAAVADAADGDVAELRYADDDAAAMASFGRELGAEISLLTVLDADSQRRFPALVERALPPTMAELRRVVGAFRRRLEADVARGDEPVLVFFYSGHGSVRPNEDPALAMLDGALTRAVLYDEILSALPARYVHLIVDACHAEAVVRPRDAQADVVVVGPRQLDEYAARNTLRRFPNVGAVVATSTAAETHEWDQYQRGVFTFQVLSGLRGAADVNGDGLVEYSELSAFLGSANAGVLDPRARLAVVARPPGVNPRAPIADLSPLRRRATALTGVGPSIGRFFVEDERGNRLVELLPEGGFRFSLYVPGDEPLFLRSATGESLVRPQPGARVAVEGLPVAPRSLRARGAVESSLRRGLFATPFGPTYYRGFVDARAELPPVLISREPVGAGADEPGAPRSWATARGVGWTLAAAGVVGLGVGALFAVKLAATNRDIDRTCAAGGPCLATDRARYEADVADAKNQRVLSAVGFAAGGAALLTGAALLIFTNDKHPQQDGSLSMRATIGAGGVGAAIGGTW